MKNVLPFSMGKHRFSLTFVCALLLLSSNHLEAQQDDSPLQGFELAARAVGDLHTSTLVVRLPTFRKKVDYALAQIRNGSSANYHVSAEILVESFTDRAILYDGYIQAFRQEYDFSRVAFIFNHQMAEFLEGSIKPKGFDLKSEVDIPPGEDIFLLTLDNVNGIDAGELNIRNRDLDIIGPPMPNGFISGGVAGIFSSFKTVHPAHSQVRRMNKKLWRYFGKTAAYRATGIK